MLTDKAKLIFKFLETTGEKIIGSDDSKEYNISCFLCTDKRHRLGINKESGKWRCFNCSAGGNKLSTLEWAFKNRKKVKNNDTIEKTEQEHKCKIPPNFHRQYFKEIFNTKDNDCAKYLMKERGFSQEAIKHFELGFRWEFKGRRGNYDGGDHLVIPYIKEGKCVNVKYRKLKPESKTDKWRREEGGVSALYNDAVIDNFDYNEIILCHPVGFNIDTVNGPKRIEDIVAGGDVVVSDDSKRNKITALRSRNISEDIYSVDPAYYPHASELTKEHPVQVSDVPSCSCPSWKLRCKPTCARLKRYKTLKCPNVYTPRYVRADEIDPKKHFLVRDINRKTYSDKKISKLSGLDMRYVEDSEFWFILGYWLGDGSTSFNKIKPNGKHKNNAVQFYWHETVSKGRKTYCAKKIKSFFSKHNIHVSESKDEETCTIVYSITNERFCAFFRSFYYAPKEKYLNDYIQYLSKDYQIDMLRGYWFSDGHQSLNKNRNDLKISSASLSLLKGIQDLILRFNVLAPIHLSRKAGKSVIQGREVNCKQLYNLVLPTEVTEKIESGFYINNLKGRKTSTHYFIVGDKCYYKFKLNKYKYTGKVYNVEVENNHSYLSNSITFHNCESELDAISIWEMGYKNVIGLTTGANGFKNKPEWVDRLERFDRIYLVLDADKAGQDGARNLATMLGMGRCFNVVLPEDAQDPNDFLLHKKYSVDDFTDLLAKGTMFEVRNTKSLRSLHKKFHHEKFISKERESASKYDTPWKPVNSILGPLNDGYLFVLGGKPKAGKCLVFSSTVINPVDMTPVTIEQAVKDKLETIHSYNEETKKLEVCKISNWIDSGVKEMTLLETESGRSVETTGHHKYLTLNGWKEVDDLKIGESIAIPKLIPFEGKKSIGSDKCVILGALIADGCLGNGFVGYTKKCYRLRDIVSKAVNSEYNLGIKHREKYDYVFTNGRTGGSENQLMKYIRELKLDTLSKNKKIPSEIYSLNNKELGIFLGSLFSHDGSLHKKSNSMSFEYGSASEELIDGISHLLLRLGILVQKRYKKAKCNGKEFDYWRFTITQNSELNKLLSKVKFIGDMRDVAKNIGELPETKDNANSYPKEIWETILEERNKKGISSKVIPIRRSRKCSLSALRKINEVIKSDLLVKFIDSDITFSEVVFITKTGKKQCYDLTVPKNENFLSDDIVCHNTSIAMDMMKHWGKKGHNCGIYSCEMRGDRLHDKWLMSEPHRFPSKNGIDYIDELSYYRACLRLPSNNLHIFNPTVQDDILIDGVVANSEAMIKRHNLKILVVDNLHYLCRGGDENAMVSEATQKLKLLAERLDVMVVLIVHPKKTNTNKQLKPEDLKGSSSIIQDADVIWLQHRPFQNDDMKEDEVKTGYAKHDPMSFKTDISITGRFTEGGRTFLYFSGAYSTFKCSGIGYDAILSEFGTGGKRSKRKKRGL